MRVNVPPLEHILEAELLDVAQAGAGLQVESPLAPGTIVTFRCGSQRIYGAVEHCRAVDRAHRIGVRINDVTDE